LIAFGVAVPSDSTKEEVDDDGRGVISFEQQSLLRSVYCEPIISPVQKIDQSIEF
jgi:hypothetical protein